MRRPDRHVGGLPRLGLGRIRRGPGGAQAAADAAPRPIARVSGGARRLRPALRGDEPNCTTFRQSTCENAKRDFIRVGTGACGVGHGRRSVP